MICHILLMTWINGNKQHILVYSKFLQFCCKVSLRNNMVGWHFLVYKLINPCFVGIHFWIYLSIQIDTFIIQFHWPLLCRGQPQSETSRSCSPWWMHSSRLHCLAPLHSLHGDSVTSPWWCVPVCQWKYIHYWSNIPTKPLFKKETLAKSVINSTCIM